MISEKFGLDELQRYVDEVGLSRFRGDVRTIKGILAVVGIPNTIVAEGTEVIAACQEAVEVAVDNIASTKAADKEDNNRVKREKARLAAERRNTKHDNSVLVDGVKAARKEQSDEIRRLSRLLSRFS